MFQDVLDHATIHLDSELNDRLLNLFETHQLRISIAETISTGAIAQRFGMMDRDNQYMTTGFICPNTVSLIEYCQVPSSLLKDLGTPELAKAMVKGLHKKCKTSICLSTSGQIQMKSDHETYEANIHFGVYIQGVIKVKSMTINGGSQTFYTRMGQAALKTLEGFLIQHFDTEGEN